MSSNPNTIVVDNGDTIQGNYNHLFLTEEYLNSNMNPMVFAMNQIGYTSFSLGNHEFNYGMTVLNKIAEQANDGGTAVLCANLYKDGARVFEPYTIKTIDGVRVAVIGVVTNHITRWDADKLVGYTPTNPAEEVKKVMTEIEDKADIFIVTSHMGLTSEYGDGDSVTDIDNLNPDVDVIVAGHSHSSMQQEIVNGVLVTQPNNNGQGVSKAEYSVVINNFMLTGGDGYDFSKGTEAKDTFVVMRDAMAKEWKENGIPKVDYNVLVAGLDDTREEPIKPEEPKPEQPKPEEKPNKPGKLPQTGMPIGADMVAMMGIVSVVMGGYVYKKRRKDA